MPEDQIYLPQTPFPEINVTAKRKKPGRVITSPEWSHENINAANSATEREKKVSKQIAKATREKMDQAGHTGAAIAAGVATLPTLATPAGLVGFGLGMAGGYGVDNGVNYFSDGKYQNWGKMVADKTGTQGTEQLWQLSNPGYFVGGRFLRTLSGKTPTYNFNARIVERDPSLLTEAIQDFENNISKTNHVTATPIATSIFAEEKQTSQPKTSLSFFERQRSKLNEAEKFGINKADRNNLTDNELQALEDLAQYKNSGQYRQVFRMTPNLEDVGWNLNHTNPIFIREFTKSGQPMRGAFARARNKDNTGIISFNPEKNQAVYTSRMFPTEYGEASSSINGSNSQQIILTSPQTDFFDAQRVIQGDEEFGLSLPNIIDKNIMKDFWINLRKLSRPGTYISGDNGVTPKGANLIQAFKTRQLHKVNVKERPLTEQFTVRQGLSPDSYSAIIRQGNRDGSLRWGEGFEKWNTSAIENKSIYEAWNKMQKGEISIPEYERIFNSWSQSIGGKPLQIIEKNGNIHIIHPHPYIFVKKSGGKLNYLNYINK